MNRSNVSSEIVLQLERLFALIALMSFHILVHRLHMSSHSVPAGDPLLTRFHGTLKPIILFRMFSELMFLQIIFGAEVLSALGANVAFVRFSVFFHFGHDDEQAASRALTFFPIVFC